MNERRVMVIGASLAGLYCAARLAEQGIPVAVYDQVESQTPARPRTLIVTSSLVDLLPEVQSNGLVKNRVTRFRLHSNGQELVVPLAKPDLVVERREMLDLLEGLCLRRGVEINHGFSFLNMVPTQHGLVVELWDRRRRAKTYRQTRTLVAADGALSRVARVAAIDGRPRVPILQARVQLPASWDPATVDTWFAPEVTSYFFWLIPDSPTTGVLGLVADTPQQARKGLLSFLATHGMEPLAMEGAWVALYQGAVNPVRHYRGGSVYLVGDCAGHVKVSTVGGTVTGLVGAEAAARAIATGRDYQRELRQLRRELEAHRLVRLVLSRFAQEDYGRLFASLTRRTLSLLSCRDRDHLASGLLPHLIRQPSLLACAARALLRRSPRH
ncbi:MAG: NAD(P)/FAD-dependent oxidoreductase [Candidatus Oleimicrobiaceae bacterium]